LAWGQQGGFCPGVVIFVQVLTHVVSHEDGCVALTVSVTGTGSAIFLPTNLKVTIATAASITTTRTIFIQSLLFLGWQQSLPQPQSVLSFSIFVVLNYIKIQFT